MSASGKLDRAVLDAAGVGPVRVQDRTATLWILDSTALAATLPDDEGAWPDGVERDAAGYPTGVLRRLDGWLRWRLPSDRPDVGEVGRWLARHGVTAVTDATATNGPDEVALLGSGGLPQRLTAMTADASCPMVSGVTRGPVKIVLDEADLPGLVELAERVRNAHAGGRRVAFHCVDGASLVLALATGIGAGDRIEHASVVRDEHLGLLARSGVTVVVQPGLVLTRGDRYLAETDPRDHADLHRLASFLAAGVPVKVSSDAPFGPADPWTAVTAAAHRRTASGVDFGPGEALDPAVTLGLMGSGPAGQSSVGSLSTGAAADLIVLDDNWDSLATHPPVALTMIDGDVVHQSLEDRA